MKIAILHEMLIKLGGAEKVVENWMNLFPNAEIVTLIYDEEKVGNVFPITKINAQTFNTKSQKVYSITKKQRFCLPYMAKSVESFDFTGFDIVLVSSSGFAHGAITKPETKLIVYYHSPARYIWDWTNEYKKDLGLNSGWKKYIMRPIINSILYKFRQWDYIASKRNDMSIANSNNTKNRIKKYYKKESLVIYAPIETDRFSKKINTNFDNVFKNKDYYIIISALTEYKKIEIAINGFNEMKDKNLIIVGQGNYKNDLEGFIKGGNIKLVGAKYGDELVYLLQNANGLIFPGEEDFGMVPIEAMAAGKPIFAYRGGGLLETNIDGITGSFFSDKEGKDFVEEFLKFDYHNENGMYKKEECIKQAKKFDKKIFENKILDLVKR